MRVVSNRSRKPQNKANAPKVVVNVPKRKEQLPAEPLVLTHEKPVEKRIEHTVLKPHKAMRKGYEKQTKQKNHPSYGTSKLEDRFARDFLDKLGVQYIRQFEAKSIGRFYDFKVKDGPLIEVDGGFWHGDKRLLKEGQKLSHMQKRNQLVDELKNEWAMVNGIPLIRIWEKDINENPSAVMRRLRKELRIPEGKSKKKPKK